MGALGLLFLDSGAFTLYNREVKSKKKTTVRVSPEEYSYYETPEFWAYVDEYATFIKKHRKCIDYYANVDAIYNPEKTWEVQCYMEQTHGLAPVPVIHYGTNLKWVRKYIDSGHDLLGIGGIAFGVKRADYIKWADRLFRYICPAPSYLPIIRTHGFAVTSYQLFLRYPWWSVDSSTWTKAGAYGEIIVPRNRKGTFKFNVNPYRIIVSDGMLGKTFANGKHFLKLSLAEQRIVLEWLEQIGLRYGKRVKGEIVERGVSNDHAMRRLACLLFFEQMRKSLPEYPWPFRPVQRKGFFV